MLKKFITMATVSVASATSISAPTPATIVLENEFLRAEVVPAWAGRLMSFARKGGQNVLWTDPDAAGLTVDADGKALWRNVGGEKTWVGSQGAGWRAFAGVEEGPVWPPPAWFDSEPFEVILNEGNRLLLRSGAGRFKTGMDWECAVEREFTLDGDTLVIDQRLVPAGGGRFMEPDARPLPDDIRRLWSITQVPRPHKVAMRICGEGRHNVAGEMQLPREGPAPGWLWIDIAPMVKWGKIVSDGDALSFVLPDSSGRLTISQSADPRHLSAFATPGRAMVYASPIDYSPSAYVELEFAAYGPDAAQRVEMRMDPVEWNGGQGAGD